MVAFLGDSILRWTDYVEQQRRSLEKYCNGIAEQVFQSWAKRTRPKATRCWAKESYEIAVKIAYENGNLRGTPKGQARDCRDVPDANFISRGYAGIAKLIADRRVYLAGYRMADLLERITSE